MAEEEEKTQELSPAFLKALETYLIITDQYDKETGFKETLREDNYKAFFCHYKLFKDTKVMIHWHHLIKDCKTQEDLNKLDLVVDDYMRRDMQREAVELNLAICLKATKLLDV